VQDEKETAITSAAIHAFYMVLLGDFHTPSSLRAPRVISVKILSPNIYLTLGSSNSVLEQSSVLVEEEDTMVQMQQSVQKRKLAEATKLETPVTLKTTTTQNQITEQKQSFALVQTLLLASVSFQVWHRKTCFLTPFVH
jgi:hypothetical protein